MDFAQLIPPYSPSAWLDLDALDHNIHLVNQKTAAVRLRIATKSVRSLDVLRYIQSRTPHYIGLMSYSAAETVFLLQHGFDNILCAYPSLDSGHIEQALAFVKQGKTVIFMADHLQQWQCLDQAGQRAGVTVSVCLDINMSMPLPKIYFGTKRSSLMNLKDVQNLLNRTKDFRHSKVTAVMGYEAQIAGLPERAPQKTWLAPIIRSLKQRSKQQLSQRRQEIVEWLNANGYPLDIVNGGGSGSMAFTCAQPEITEITVGSAYYYPALFGYMDSMDGFRPATGFVLPVTRHPESHVITAHGGGFIASGSLGEDKQPRILYPQHLEPLTDEGFGEVQTPLQWKKPLLPPLFSQQQKLPHIGDFIWCQHAKAGELCERFNELITYRKQANGQYCMATMQTYRGLGQCFH